MSQEELGALLGVSKSAVQKYESGKINDLRADKIRILCETFHVVPTYFIFTEDNSRSILSENAYKLISSKFPLSSLTSDVNIEFFQGKSEWEFFKIIYELSKLNTKGLKKIRDYANDISRLDEYRQSR